MARLRPNFSSGKLTDASISSTVQQLNSPQFANLPVVVTPNILVIQLDPLSIYGQPEIDTIISHAAGSQTVTVERGQDGPVGGLFTRAHNQAGVQEDWYCSYTDQDFVHATLTGLAADDHGQYYGPIGDPADRHQVVGAHSDINILSDIFFPGFTMLWPGAVNSMPAGWLWCNNQDVAVSTYPNLFAALGNGTIWGHNSGAGTFKLPPGGVLLAAAGGAGNLAVGAISNLLAHLHGVNLNSASVPAFSAGHTHAFAAGVHTFDELQQHGHNGATPGSGQTGLPTIGHTHDMAGITTNGQGVATGPHVHNTAGNTGTGSSGQTAGVWNVMIHT